MTKKMRRRLNRIIIGSIIYALSFILLEFSGDSIPLAALLVPFLIAYFVIGGEVVKTALMNIGKGQVFDENFLMMVATAGAFIVGEYPEAVAVMLFYQVGEFFQSYAVNKSRNSIADLMDIRPDYANVIRNGEEIEIDPLEVRIGETIRIKPGEKVPLDGIVTLGASTLDTMALTGESIPREVMAGEEVISGCVNIQGVLEVKVEKEFGESTVSKILDLVENASSKKAGAENFITKFARYYTPVVVICAVALAIIPPVIAGGDWSTWIYRALTFLVISCPCALVISIPLSFFGGIGGASKNGILVKGSNYLEALADTKTIVMDKTGTLTKGNFAVAQIQPEGIREGELLELAALAESYSNHPISKSLMKAYKAVQEEWSRKELDKGRVGQVEEIAGFGVDALIDGCHIYAGNDKLMERQGIAFEKSTEAGTIVYVARDRQYLGFIRIADEIKEDSKKAVESMRRNGIREIIMLTGDKKETAAAVAKEIGITKYYAELLPGDKVDKVEALLKEKDQKEKLAFVGDGINDAPVLARADIGIAMGGLGSDAAIEAADIVIMTDEPSKIATAMKISRKTLAIVKQNIVFAIGIKVLVLLLAAVGMASMWAAVFADVGVAVIAILNAMRALQVKE